MPCRYLMKIYEIFKTEFVYVRNNVTLWQEHPLENWEQTWTHQWYTHSHFVQSLKAACETLAITKPTMTEMSVNRNLTYLPKYENFFLILHLKIWGSPCNVAVLKYVLHRYFPETEERFYLGKYSNSTGIFL